MRLISGFLIRGSWRSSIVFIRYGKRNVIDKLVPTTNERTNETNCKKKDEQILLVRKKEDYSF